jgi:outer membrane receptor protein involved in Fe transport
VVPGLIATQHSGNGKANQYFLRGFNLDHGTDLSAIVDGVPNNLPTHGHGQGYNDLNGLIPELIETIEYRKGPYSVESGDFSSAATVDIRYVDSIPKDMFEYTVGEHGFHRGLYAHSGQYGDVSTLLAFEGGLSDGPWDKDEDVRRANAIARVTTGDDHSALRFGASYYRNEWQSNDQIPLRAVESGLITPSGQLDPDLGGETRRYTLLGEWHHHRDPAHEIRVHGYASGYRLKLFSNFTYFLDDEVQGDQFEQVDDRKYYGGKVHYTHYFGEKSDHSLILGVDFRHDDIDEIGLYRTNRRQRLSTVRKDAVDQSSAAIFLSYDFKPFSWFRAVPGVRFDAYRAKIRSRSEPINSGSASDTQFSPKLSLVFGPWADTRVFVNAGRGFHSNDVRGATLRVDPTDPSVPATSLDLIVPTTGYEIGMQSQLSKNLLLSATAWKLRIGSELVFLGDGGTTEANRGSDRSGIELSSIYRPKDWLTIDADYSRSKARFHGDDPAGDRIPGAVETVASLGIIADVNSGWFGSLRFRYIGPAALIEDNSVRSDSSTMWNAEFGRRFSNGMGLSLEIVNLTDSDDNDITYFYESRLAGETVPVADLHYRLLEPRQFRLKFSYDF